MPIPKKLFTIWISDRNTLPKLIEQCIKTQQIPGYEHKIVGMETFVSLANQFPYLKQCLDSSYTKEKYVKAADYMRLHILHQEGGIYLDADIEILPGKNFDKLLHNNMFLGKEKNGWLANSVIGAEQGYPFLKSCMKDMEEMYRGDDNKCFEAGSGIMAEKYYHWRDDDRGLAVCEQDVFFPYDHLTNTTNITEETITFHHFMKSWCS
jgi:mannosyltransferase OCH1-like enzyme